MATDLLKTVSFLGLHLVVGFSVAYAFTGSIAIAGGIALIEPCANAIVFFFHERFWRKSQVAVGSDLLCKHEMPAH